MRLAGLAALAVLAGVPGAARGIDLSGYMPVFEEEFEDGLQSFETGRGIWSTTLRRDALVTNSPLSLFLPAAETARAMGLQGPDPFDVADGVLAIRAVPLGAAELPGIRAALRARGHDAAAETVRYATGAIHTARSWAQTYGYFEIRARIPEGKGRWPAFWLAPAGIGWPPEIDIVEAYGRGLAGTATERDDLFTSGVFFDARDADGATRFSTDLVNPYDAPGGVPARPLQRRRGDRPYAVFRRSTDARAALGADIYGGFRVWAALWTPETIRFFFGPDRAGLREIYRVPTPGDLHSPLYVIANDQVGSNWGWDPAPGLDRLTFAPGNAFRIDRIAVWAPRPEQRRRGSGGLLRGGPGAERLVGTAGDDVIAGGGGLDVVETGGGRDLIGLRRGEGNLVIEDFAPGDRLVLDGFPFDGARDAAARLIQVGADVWLPAGAYPADPQTVIFRNASRAAFSEADFVVRWSQTPDLWSSRRLAAARLTDADGDGRVRAGPEGSRLSDGPGPKELIGSAAPDEYFVYAPGTRIHEPEPGGVDTVYAHVDHRLAPGIEVLAAAGAAEGLHLVGNARGNRIVGSPGDDTLDGGPGDDLLVLGGGRDVVVYRTGEGCDRLVGFDPASDRILWGRDGPRRLAPCGADLCIAAPCAAPVPAGRLDAQSPEPAGN